jgi:acetyl esterase/lipase
VKSAANFPSWFSGNEESVLKNRAVSLVLCGLVFLTPSASAWGEDQPEYRRTRDVIYGKKDGLAFTFDVFTPAKNANGAAIVMMVSGGYFSRHESINPVFCTPFLKRGYTVFTVVHGSQPRFTIPEILENVNRAVRYVRYHAADFHIDPKRLGATGASAGGHLSLMVGTAGKEGEAGAADPVDKVSSRVQAVACFFPPTDYMNFGGPGKEHIGDVIGHRFRPAFDYHVLDPATGRLERLADHEKVRAITRAISPIYYVNAQAAPALLIHGDKDRTVPIQQSEAMVAKFKEVGVPAKLVVRPGADHGWPEVLKDIDLLVDWFDKYLSKPMEESTVEKRAESK